MFNMTKILLIVCSIIANIILSSGQTQRIFCDVCSCRGKYISCARGFPSLHRILKATRTGSSNLLVRSDFSFYQSFKDSIDRLFKSVIVLDGGRETSSTRPPTIQPSQLDVVLDSTLSGKSAFDLVTTGHTPRGITRIPQKSTLHINFLSHTSTSTPSEHPHSRPIDRVYSSYIPPSLGTPALGLLFSPITDTTTEKETLIIEEGKYLTSPPRTPGQSHESPGVEGSVFFLNYYTLCGIGIGIIPGGLLVILLRYLWIHWIYRGRCQNPSPRRDTDIVGREDIEMHVF